MHKNFLYSCMFLALIGLTASAASEPAHYSQSSNQPSQAPESIPTSQLQGFATYSAKEQQIVETILALAQKDLGYQYGSADPKNGAMDCSGTMHYLLTQLGIQSVPRSSEALYQWSKKAGHFQPMATGSLQSLRPGDLLFWKGTYETPTANIASHVMVYLGKDLQGRPLMAGASNGRTYKGRKIYGVSVFDFILPAANSKSTFLGHSCVPYYSC